ncbi:hypothetical protein E2562_021378 [Oryza meyeriana var. granulata]|uniref:Uncharacterized protein n=1 Tax=Oryza meyeriana var. granulata TaxID=110450 RepID=A0A6G1CHR5_9ORYZ|nr:hypothetical protein E2562_021378 [Oryza meyeriana var. granulata]
MAGVARNDVNGLVGVAGDNGDFRIQCFGHIRCPLAGFSISPAGEALCYDDNRRGDLRWWKWLAMMTLGGGLQRQWRGVLNAMTA